MGNLLIVDDEPDILVTLEELFKYESGLDIDVYVAKSATMAVNLLEKIRFDVVMTDIKMPGMTGIELFHLIKENWPKCRVIFLTGYRDFDDLYQIMGNKDVRYLLKSESYEVLIQNVAEAFREIEQMMLSEMKEYKFQKNMKQAQTVLQRNYLKECFYGNDVENLSEEKLNAFSIPLVPEEALFVFLLRIDSCEGYSFEEGMEKEWILNEVLQEFLPVKIKYFLYYDSDGYYLVFFQPEHFMENPISARTWNRLYANLSGALEYIQQKLLTKEALSVSFVTCDERCYLKDSEMYLNRLKREAIGRIGSGVQRIIRAKTPFMQTSVQKVPENLQVQVKHLEQFLESKRYGEFVDMLQSLTSLLYGNEEKLSTEITELYYSISILLLRYININHLKGKIDQDISLNALIDIDIHKNRKDAAEYLNSIANKIVLYLESDGRNRTQEVLEKVVIYIEGHLQEELTLTKLADISYLNASYLSRIFKQTYGCNVTEYISNKRLEKAKILLTTTSKKIQDVSVEVGYLSVPSFNRVFKKVIGISPVEYRDRYGDRNREIF
ncbi:MAG: response regulator [Oliverpabstia sp.]